MPNPDEEPHWSCSLGTTCCGEWLKEMDLHINTVP